MAVKLKRLVFSRCCGVFDLRVTVEILEGLSNRGMFFGITLRLTLPYGCVSKAFPNSLYVLRVSHYQSGEGVLVQINITKMSLGRQFRSTMPSISLYSPSLNAQSKSLRAGKANQRLV